MKTTQTPAASNDWNLLTSIHAKTMNEATSQITENSKGVKRPYRLKDITGQRFGRLIVLSFEGRRSQPSGQSKSYWNTQCECGSEKVVSSTNLKNGSTTSCGCFRKEVAGQQAKTHGMSQSKIYNVWNTMVQRCTNPEVDGYKNYGGRGVTVCDRWRKVDNFLEDMLSTYQEGLTIERRENKGNYEPSNCYWATRAIQARNRRNNRVVEFRGEKHILVEWAEILGIPANVLGQRAIHKDWTIERAFTQPVRKSSPRKL